MVLWNEKHLPAPSVSTCKLKNQELNLNDIQNRFRSCSEVFFDQVQFNLECKLLAFIIRARKASLHSDVGFKNLQKFSRALNAFQQVNYSHVLSSFIELLPRRYESETYFPSRNMLDYFLVRSQGIAKLICKIFEYANSAHMYWTTTLKRGHHIGISFIVLSVISRLFMIIRYFLQHLCEVYDDVLPLREKISNVKFCWLPQDYVFPTKLRVWLDIEWVFNNILEKPQPQFNLFSINLADDDQDVQITNEYTLIDDAEDMRIVNEYMNILDSDEEKEFEETRGEVMAAIKSEMNLESETKSDIIQNSVNLDDDDIGEPIELNSKLSEVTAKLSVLRNMKHIINFVKDDSHTYFRSLGNAKFHSIVNYLMEEKLVFNAMLKSERKSKIKQVKDRLIDELKHDVVILD